LHNANIRDEKVPDSVGPIPLDEEAGDEHDDRARLPRRKSSLLRFAHEIQLFVSRHDYALCPTQSNHLQIMYAVDHVPTIRSSTHYIKTYITVLLTATDVCAICIPVSGEFHSRYNYRVTIRDRGQGRPKWLHA